MNRPGLFRSSWTAVLLVWFFLLVATLLSYLLGAEQWLGTVPVRSSLILAIALVKVRFIGLYFMELRAAPTGVRILFETWCQAAGIALIAMYLLA
jgi:cytochrome c oxidase subunit IV